jgi:hypothetical protein
MDWLPILTPDAGDANEPHRISRSYVLADADFADTAGHMLDLRDCRIYCGKIASVDSADSGLPAGVAVLLRRQAATEKREGGLKP